MSLRTYLDDQSFDAETVRLMGVAFEIALATLRPPDSDPLREAVAWKIIELAKKIRGLNCQKPQKNQ